MPPAIERTLTPVELEAALANTVSAVLDDEVDEESGSEPRPPFPTGESRWRLHTLLGEGGMGRVFLARDQQFGREVALKEMRDEVRGRESLRRFLVEALVTGNLEHPGIPAVYERGVREGRAFYAMRKVEGDTLAVAVARARSFEQRVALLPAVVRVAHTLGFAHERGVVHRDVKPDNVVLGNHGETVLLDWGIARVSRLRLSIDGDAPPELESTGTLAGAVMGTPSYMAPEQAAGRVDDIDERTDVFALGAMLYHVLAGAPPYVGSTSVAVIAKALVADALPLRLAAPQTPPALLQVVQTAMAREPSQRYPNASAFAAALEAFLTGAAVSQPSRFMRVLGAGAALGVLVLAVLGTIALLAQVSSFRAQGFPAWGYAGMTAVGSLLSLVEWKTRGRHALGPVILTCIGITLIAGLAGLFTGLGVVARAIPHVGPERLVATLAQGIWEISGSVPTSAALAAIQLALWAIARRATMLHVSAQSQRAPATQG